MITMIKINGMSDVIMPPPSPPKPNGKLCAYAGVISIAPPGSAQATRRPA